MSAMRDSLMPGAADDTPAQRAARKALASSIAAAMKLVDARTAERQLARDIAFDEVIAAGGMHATEGAPW